LPDWGPFGSNFLEAVALPGFRWWGCDSPDGRYLREGAKCGRMVTGQPSLRSAPLIRFEAPTPEEFYYPMNRVPIGTPLFALRSRSI